MNEQTVNQILTDSFQTSITRFLGGRPRFRRNMLSKEKLVEDGMLVVKVISLLLPWPQEDPDD